ncbi:MAG: hypothetical protein R3B55_02280 [Candidatus Paceibacterota bacterium]
MDQDQEKMLRETLRLSRENNEMLHRMRGAQKRAAFWRFLKLVVSIALFVLAYRFIMPYVNDLRDSYESARSSLDQIQEARDRLPF